MNNPIAGKHILLGVTGSIAAYKAADLASKLTQAGAILDVVLTEGAEHFITPLTFQSVTGRKCYIDQDLWGGEGHVTHIGIGRAAEIVLIAPASANTLARLANGFGDSLLCVAVLASSCPLILCPAMDAGMYSHPATVANVELLRQRGALFIGPEEGHLASGLMGLGRFTEPPDIVANLKFILSRNGPLSGKKIVVTAGGTQEPIDPVRVISNRSSGKQGYAVAEAALASGADVTLISGPTHLPMPVGAKVIHIQTANELLSNVLFETATADALIMAAAVADYRPANPAEQKIKKKDAVLQITLEPTLDILAKVAEKRSSSNKPNFVIGFAAESQDLIQNAEKKLKAKRLDMIVANDISAANAGFEVDTNRVTLLKADGSQTQLPLMSKMEVAGEIIQVLTTWFEKGQ